MSRRVANSDFAASPARSTEAGRPGESQKFLVGIDVGSTTVKAVVSSEPGASRCFAITAGTKASRLKPCWMCCIERKPNWVWRTEASACS